MAMTDYFLQIEGLHGREFEDPLPLLSWSFGEKNSSGTFLNNGPEAGKLQMLAFSFTRALTGAARSCSWRVPKGNISRPRFLPVAQRVGNKLNS